MQRPFLPLGLLLVAAVAGCLGGGAPPTESPAAASRSYHVETVASGFDTIWAVDFAPDGRIFLTERPGRIRVIGADGVLDPTPWAEVSVVEQSESGLMGIALHPDFPTTASVYVYHTYGLAAPLFNKVVRYSEVGGRGVPGPTIIDQIPANVIHDGGRIKFGPDGLLYVTTGDAAVDELNQRRAQDQNSLAGKILRLKPDGAIPDGNAKGPVYTFGHRNPQGICWSPANGELYATEHGPDTDDEVNLIQQGKNYGWPDHRGTDRAEGFEPALRSWTPTIAPAGCTFYDDTTGARPDWDNNLFFVTLKDRDLRRLTIDPNDPARVTDEQILFDREFGRLRDVVQGPDGLLYLATSNHDGRGQAQEGDDRLLRIVFD